MHPMAVRLLALLLLTGGLTVAAGCTHRDPANPFAAPALPAPLP